MTENLSQKSRQIDDNKANAKWYVVHTYSGYENKVKINIEATIENRHLENEIFEVVVPVHDVTEIKNGTSLVKSKKSFPGYVIVNMIMNNDTWFVVRNTRGVTGFVGPGSEPVALTEEEVLNLGITPMGYEFDIEVGDEIIVSNGPWKDTVAKVIAVNDQKQTVEILVEVFGGETKLELGMLEVKKI